MQPGVLLDASAFAMIAIREPAIVTATFASRNANALRSIGFISQSALLRREISVNSAKGAYSWIELHRFGFLDGRRAPDG
jgi:hypothetical protein